MMKQIFSSVILLFILTGCSEQYYWLKMGKTPRLSVQKNKEYKNYNKYQKDILYLAELLELTHPALFENYSIQEFEKDKKDLILKFENKEEKKIVYALELQKFLAKVKDVHTYITIDTKEFFFKKRNAVFFKWFGNDLYIIKIAKTIDSNLIGSKVITINDKPVSEVKSLLLPFQSSENEYYALDNMAHLFIHPEYLYYNFINNSLDSLKLKVFSEKFNYKEVIIPALDNIEWIPSNLPKPITAYNDKTFSYQIFSNYNLCYFQFNECFDKTVAIEGIKESFNPFIQVLARLFFHFYSKKHKTIDFRDFLREMFYDIDEKKVENIVIDLRYNTGGQSILEKQFLYYIETEKKIEDFTEITKISEAFKKQNTKLFKKYNILYQEKYNQEIPDKLINLTELENDTSFFKEIQDKKSPFYTEKPEKRFKGNIYLLINSITNSAASDFAVLLHDNQLCTTVGIPTGNKPTKATGAFFFKLPNTKISGSVSSYYSVRPDTTKNKECCLFPHIPIERTIKEYFNGIDPSFNYIRNIISENNNVIK